MSFIFVLMDYFKDLKDLIKKEKDREKEFHLEEIDSLNEGERQKQGRSISNLNYKFNIV